jgi:hypothetical protein
LSAGQAFCTTNAKRLTMELNPFHIQTAAALTNVLAGVGATNSDAVQLVLTEAFFESRHHHSKRNVWNWTAGPLLTVTETGVDVGLCGFALAAGAPMLPLIWINPFWLSSNSIEHTVVLVDPDTRDVLWINQQSFKHLDPRDAQVLQRTVNDTTVDLTTLPCERPEQGTRNERIRAPKSTDP